MVGIGGGKTIDTAKYAATRYGMPMVSVATSLSHDGIASPVSTLDNEGIRGSYGVHMPIAVVVDLDFVEKDSERHSRAGIGELVSNISALADWELGREVHGEPVDGLAVTLSPGRGRGGAQPPGRHDRRRVRHRCSPRPSSPSGLAMAVCGSTRPMQRWLPRDLARHRP